MPRFARNDEDYVGGSISGSVAHFAPGGEDFNADNKAPGHRWIDPHADGRKSTISDLREMNFLVDPHAGAYLT